MLAPWGPATVSFPSSLKCSCLLLLEGKGDRLVVPMWRGWQATRSHPDSGLEMVYVAGYPLTSTIDLELAVLWCEQHDSALLWLSLRHAEAVAGHSSRDNHNFKMSAV